MPSARRATQTRAHPEKAAKISTHALREEGDISGVDHIVVKIISTHALREEGDLAV